MKSKRIISFILILAMSLTLTACTKTVKAQGVNLYVVASGINSSKVTIKVSGEFPEGTTPEIKYHDEETIKAMEETAIAMNEDLREQAKQEFSVLTDSSIQVVEDEEILEELSEYDYLINNNLTNASIDIEDVEYVQYISVDLKKSSENYLEYVVSGLNEGSDELVINFVKDGYSYSKVAAQINVNEKNKISSCTLKIGEVQERYELTEDLTSSDMESSVVTFTMKDETASWKNLEYDSDIIVVSGPTYDLENKVTTWTVSGKAEGLASMSIVNEELKKRTDVQFEVWEVFESYQETETQYESEAEAEIMKASEQYLAEMEERNKEDEEYEINRTYYLRIVASGDTEYDSSLSKAEIDKINTHTVSKEVKDEQGNVTIVTETVPYIDNMYIPSNAKVLSFEEYDQENGSAVIEMNLEFEGKSISVRSEAGELTELKKILVDDSLGEKSEFEVAGIKVECYEGNIDIYLFEKDGVVYELVILEDPSYDEHKALVEKYIG